MRFIHGERVSDDVLRRQLPPQDLMERHEKKEEESITRPPSGISPRSGFISGHQHVKIRGYLDRGEAHHFVTDHTVGNLDHNFYPLRR